MFITQWAELPRPSARHARLWPTPLRNCSRNCHSLWTTCTLTLYKINQSVSLRLVYICIWLWAIPRTLIPRPATEKFEGPGGHHHGYIKILILIIVYDRHMIMSIRLTITSIVNGKYTRWTKRLKPPVWLNRLALALWAGSSLAEPDPHHQ